MTHTIISAADGLAMAARAAHVHVLAAYGGGLTWTDMLWGTFYEWKWWAAGGSLMILCTTGIFMLGRARLIGAGLIALGLACGVFFARIEHFIGMSQNTEQKIEHNQHGNPFQRVS